MVRPTVLVVDDDKLIRWSLRQRLEATGYHVQEGEGGRQALELCSEADLVLLDYRLPDADGLALLRRIRQEAPDALVILMTGYSSIEHAIEAIKQGAYHYVNKPFDFDALLLLVEKALETTRLRREVRTLRARQSAPYSFDRIIGESPPMRSVKALLAKIATTPTSTVLLTGESGTGKDLAAQCIHYNGDRSAAPFMHINSTALPEPLLESELFGHERGAFTDARQQRRGLLELADHGTVFLDEIGDMALGIQVKLLRFLEAKAFKRLGGAVDVRVDVRVIAATNRDLAQAVRNGTFREDLYYRLSVLTVELPPLRERGGDLALLTNCFVDSFNREFRKSVNGISPAGLEVLEAYPWPGNVRELRNALERAVLLGDGGDLRPEDLVMLAPDRRSLQEFRLPPGGIDVEALEKDLVAQALTRAGGNHGRAAALLGMSRDQIRYRIQKFGLVRTGNDPEPAKAPGSPTHDPH